MQPRRPLLIASFVAVCVVWGSTYLGIRVALEGFPPFMLAGLRFLLAGAVLYALARSRGEPAPKRAQWGSAMVTGTLLFVVGNGLVNFAEQSVSSGLASVLVSTTPLWATLFGRFLGAPVSGREAAGVLLGLAGVVVLELGGDLRASPMGAMYCLAAPMGWALGSLASRRLPMPDGVMMRTASQMLCGGLATAGVSVILGEHLVAAPSARAIVAQLYLVTFGSLVGFSAYSYLLSHTRTVVATSYAYVNPVIAVVLGVVVAHEHVGVESAVGGAIVLAAVVLVVLGQRAGQSRASASRSRSIVEVGSGSDPNRSATPSSPTTT